MANFREALRERIKSFLCEQAEDNEKFYRWTRSKRLSTAQSVRTAERIRRWLCSNKERPIFENEFVDGGCATNYRVSFEAGCLRFGNFGNPDLPYTAQYTATIAGPLGNLAILIPGLRSGGLGNGEAPLVNYGFGDGPAIGSFTGSDASLTFKNNGDNQCVGAPEGLTIVRIDGLPDNCEPDDNPVPFSGDSDVTYIDNSGNTFIEPFGIVILPPVINLNGEITIPVNLDFSGLNLNVDLDLNGDINIDLGKDFPNGFPGPDTDPNEPPPGDDPPTDGVIIGARVFVVSNGDSTVGEIQQGANPDLYIPRAGTISFLQAAGLSTGWCRDIDVRSSPAWVPCPAPGFALKVAGTPMIGISWKITPIYGKPPAPDV